MRRVRVVGAVAVVVLAAAGCGGGDGVDAKPSESAAAASPVEEAFTPDPSPSFPDTAAGRLDRLADEKGWFVDDAGTWPSGYVGRICRGMTRVESEGQDPQQWLAEEEDPAPSPREILKAGAKDLCPRWAKEIVEVAGGSWRPDPVYADGTYVVAAEPGEPDPVSGEVAITPGRWRVSGDLEDCYWERTSRSGEILDNNFATSAQEITVTIRASDGQFTARGCGVWEKVG
ncbi:hypothetical protein [Streptomyces sp. t39]|uniref:hypothetical protein n=1 Tax=Streptomyces sp. t39 TaxID=1828156 RepID=UPI0011CE6CA5|nr:hypothetical protein [Streptomyces sp. t39]